MKEEMLEVVPTVRGQVSALRNIPDEHDAYVATYHVFVADCKSLGHAVWSLTWRGKPWFVSL